MSAASVAIGLATSGKFNSFKNNGCQEHCNDIFPVIFFCLEISFILFIIFYLIYLHFESKS